MRRLLAVFVIKYDFLYFLCVLQSLIMEIIGLLLQYTHQFLVDALHAALPLLYVLHLFFQKLDLLLVQCLLFVMLTLLISELFFHLTEGLALVRSRSVRRRLEGLVQVALLPEAGVVDVALEGTGSLVHDV